MRCINLRIIIIIMVPLKCNKTGRRLGLRPNGEGASCPFPRNPIPAVGLSCLRLRPFGLLLTLDSGPPFIQRCSPNYKIKSRRLWSQFPNSETLDMKNFATAH